MFRFYVTFPKFSKWSGLKILAPLHNKFCKVLWTFNNNTNILDYASIWKWCYLMENRFTMELVHLQKCQGTSRFEL